MVEFISINNTAAKFYDHMLCEPFTDPAPILNTQHNKDGTITVTAEDLHDGDIITKTHTFPQDDKDDAAIIVRPKPLAFSEHGNATADHMLEAYINGYYQAEHSPTVNGLELHTSLAKRFRDDHPEHLQADT